MTSKAKKHAIKRCSVCDSNLTDVHDSMLEPFIPGFSLVSVRWKGCFSEGKVWLSLLDVIVITVTQITSPSTSIKAWQPGVKVSPA